MESKLARLQSGIPVSVAPAKKADENVSGAAPVETEAKVEPVMPTPTEDRGAPATAGEGSYRPFFGWQEVIDEVSAVNAPVAAALSKSRAAITQDGRLVVRLQNAFFLKIVSTEEANATVRAAATSVGEIPVVALEFQGSAQDTTSNSILAELEAALRECK